MLDTDLRRRLAWLIGIRAIISTLLLGSATFAQLTAPGSFPVDPFFFLIGLTYALTIVYALTLPFVDRHRWLVDVQLAGDALVVSAFIYFTGGITSYFSSLYVLPIVAGSTVQFRRGGLLVATLSAVLYVGLVLAQYLSAAGLLHDPWLVADFIPLPSRTIGQVHRRPERLRLLRRGRAQRVARRGRAVGRRPPRAGVHRDRRPAGTQPARDRQPAERAGDDRPAAAHPHLQPCRRGDHRPPVPRRRRAADWGGAAAAGAGRRHARQRRERRGRAAQRLHATVRPTGAARSTSA